MASYNTKIYSPSVFQKALLTETMKNGHSGINLYRMNQIMLDDDNSLLDPNIHYSQICDEEHLKRQSFLNEEEHLKRQSFLKTDNSLACNIEEFDEEDLKLKEGNLRQKAFTLFDSNGEKTKMVVPQIELVLKTKNFTENSVDEESIKMPTSPTFQTARIGTNGRTETFGEVFDVNAQLSQIHQNSMRNTLNENNIKSNQSQIEFTMLQNSLNQKLTYNGDISERQETPQNTLNQKKQGNQFQFIADKMEMTHRSSYRSLSQLEQEGFNNNIVNFSAFFSQKEKNTNNDTKTNKSCNDFEMKLNFLNDSKTIETKGKNEDNNSKEESQRSHEDNKKDESFGFKELEERLKIINSTINAKTPKVDGIKMVKEEEKRTKKANEFSLNLYLQKPILEEPEKEIVPSSENRLSEQQSEIFEKPTVFKSLEKPLCFKSEQIQLQNDEITERSEKFEAILQSVSNEENLRNLNFFLSLEKNIKEEGDKFRNDKILNDDSVCFQAVSIQKPADLQKEITPNSSKIELNCKKSQYEIETERETNRENNNSSLNHAMFIQNKKELDALIQENKEELTKPSIKHDLIYQLPLRVEPKKQSFVNEGSRNSNPISKIADSFKEIAATISETIHKHKIEIEKECDLSVFKNFLTKAREHSNERLNKKYFTMGNFTEPDDNVTQFGNHSQELVSKSNYLSPTIKSSNISNKINKLQNGPFENITPDKPEYFIEGTTPFNYAKQISSLNLQYPSPIQVADHSISKITGVSNKRNLSSVKTTKHQTEIRKNSNFQPYFKFRSKSCEKNQKEEIKGENESFRNFVQVQNWHLNYMQKKDNRSFLKRVDQDLKKRKIQTFQNELKKKTKALQEIKNFEDINQSRGKLTANASQNLVIKLMSDAKRRNFEKEKKMKEKHERELKNAIQMANTKYVNPKSEILTTKKSTTKTTLTQFSEQDSAAPVMNFKKKSQKENSNKKIDLDCHKSGKKNPLNQQQKNSSSRKILKVDSLKENTNDSNFQTNNLNPLNDFLMNYNKKFLEENSLFSNPKEESLRTMNDQNDPLNKMVGQYEIVESDSEDEKNNFSLKNDGRRNFPFKAV